MKLPVTTGNAITDGRDFHFWFVGRIEQWCSDNNVPFEAERFGLRNASGIEIKWGIYRQGEERAEWAECSEKTAMSVLVRGRLVFYFRGPGDEAPGTEVRLKDEGDYVIWREDILHLWKMEQDSVILTLRW